MNRQESLVPGRPESGARTQMLVVYFAGVVLARLLLEAASGGAALLAPQPVWFMWPVILFVAGLTFVAPLAALATLLGLIRDLPDVAFAHGGIRAVSLGQAAINGALAIGLLWMFAVAITT